MRFTVQRFRVIAVAALSILLFTVVGATFLQPAYACAFIINLSSSTIVQGGSVSLSGDDTCGSPTDTIFVQTFQTSTCPANGIPSGTQVGADGLNPVSGTWSNLPVTFFSGQGGPGSYCVHVFSNSISTAEGPNDPLTVTSATPIPEYPVGLAILAIFMVIAYALIRRRTLGKQK